ncbi:nitrogen regulation protein NR(I) [Halothiobacillus neapolitanus]|uniref:DNA-binding transcriptional regulator NtrC n=1 Tax=Halothiobacillus neapolitanus (strain ATCC 23641 / DSM 15147 / CIP 104769 / NCIMB 8539 / c2) TaxID=555778 RepID=D0KXA5_HALNC|nr:nitrogen regulation protein NR(I) [Halothiobacillus neapolitanus]ACX95119.1 nitrogen metabolism transcriptional regulator, NtrC, Fis Family [Halothiobacillus neapolitanus c2]TDN60927.1 two-component system nitrogen regulation response regulator GlnG [Halothiobacillus neapolitanus]
MMTLNPSQQSSKNAAKIWVVDDDHSIRWVLERALKSAGFTVESFESAAMLRARLRTSTPDVLFSDIRMPGEDGLSLLSSLQNSHPELPIIIITAHSDLDSAVGAFEGGAFDYLPKPFDIDDAVRLAQRALSSRQPQAAETTAEASTTADAQTDLIGNAPAMQEIFRAIGRLARSNVTVLINGESGTGKELVARALHQHSLRRQGPFVALNTAAIPKDLLESELFGHEKGAFTGAAGQRVGRFEQAHGGTLFLDEIGDMPMDLQTRLLRVLADGQFYRVGGTQLIRTDVRIVAATHQRLEDRVASGQFREDLFHRLNVIRLKLPALRERREDIPQLLRFFLQRAAQELGVPIKSIHQQALAQLARYDWPGNVRELENTARWLTVMAPGHEIGIEDLPDNLHQSSTPGAALGDDALLTQWTGDLKRWADARLAAGDQDLLAIAGPAFERTLLKAALHFTGGHKQQAAALIGWGRNTVTRKLKELADIDDDTE